MAASACTSSLAAAVVVAAAVSGMACGVAVAYVRDCRYMASRKRKPSLAQQRSVLGCQLAESITSKRRCFIHVAGFPGGGGGGGRRRETAGVYDNDALVQVCACAIFPWPLPRNMEA